ncbi:MAG TPA: dihydrofolate reductase [Gammaproteobacteria bacterium]|nr:dihydrofolate reductase [Gammaproteobacteria bacterium]
MLSLIVAAGENNEIGKDGAMPWHLPADLRHFKAVTLGKPVIMGRHTWESIGKPLPQRRNIVVTRDKTWFAQGCEVAHSVPEALVMAAGEPEIMLIGGGQLYREALPRAQRIYLTRVHGTFDADTFFPPLDMNQWQETVRETHPADAANPYACSFLVLERRTPRNLA